MSFESALHVALVRSVCREIQSRHSQCYSLTMLVDLPEYGSNRPRRVGGYVPDVFAIDVPETVRVIGEAKTPADFETPHSQRQVTAFLAHLALFPVGFFYLCVPWTYVGRGRNLLRDLIVLANADTVAAEVVGG